MWHFKSMEIIKPFIIGVGKHTLLHGKININNTYLPNFSHQKYSRFIPKINFQEKSMS